MSIEGQMFFPHLTTPCGIALHMYPFKCLFRHSLPISNNMLSFWTLQFYTLTIDFWLWKEMIDFSHPSVSQYTHPLFHLQFLSKILSCFDWISVPSLHCYDFYLLIEKNVRPYMHSFRPEIFSGCLPCAKHASRDWGHSEKSGFKAWLWLDILLLGLYFLSLARPH